MAFSDILGNERTKNLLRNSLQKNRIPNSLLFKGPQGVGKKDTALVVAKALNCLRRNDDSCDDCPNCRAVDKGVFPDVLVIAVEKDKDEISIDQIRSLKQTAYLKPMAGKKRIFIIHNAEDMSDAAANSLLKVLEEPPLYCHIILTVQNEHLIRPTIKSRCQSLTFSSISREDIEKALLKEDIPADRARIASFFVQGNLRQARELDWEAVQSRRDLGLDILLSCLRREGAAEFLYALTSRGKREREDFSTILDILFSLFRDLLLLKNGGDRGLLFNPDIEGSLEELAGQLSHEDCLKGLQAIDSAMTAVQRRGNLALLIQSVFAHLMEREYV